jgi:rhomboid protease GluP
MFITCPHCLTRVADSPNDACPACGRRLDAAPEAPVIVVETRAASGQMQVASFHRALATVTPQVWVTPTLLIGNVAIFLAMALLADDFFSPSTEMMIQWGANFGPKTMRGEWWRLLTCAFLHFNVLHVGFNMWVLWDVGRLVERMVGNAGFVVLYLVAAIFGSIVSLAWNATVVSAGASGAVFGVCGGLLGFLILGRDSIPRPVLKSLSASMLTFLGYNILFGLRPGIDMAAHAGGLAAGSVCGLVMSQPLQPPSGLIRWRRNFGCSCIAALLAPVAIAFLPPAPPDVKAELADVSQIEAATLQAYDDAATRFQQGEISDAEFAAAVENDILPHWRRGRAKLHAISDSPAVNRLVVEKLERYFAERQESWELLLQGLDKNDADKLQQFRRKWDAANAFKL